MSNGIQPDAIDTRLVYRVYAVAVGLSGLLLLAWGPLWFGIDFVGQPWVKAALIRILGSILVAVACFAYAFVAVDHSIARRRGLLWFAAGHFVILLVVLIQNQSILGSPVGNYIVGGLLAVTMALFYLWQTANGEAGVGWRHLQPLSLFREATSDMADELRSRYEQQIRLAAGQQERNRLARDLHDSIKQQIFVMQTAAATAEVRFDNDPAGCKQALVQVRTSAREAMAEMEAMLDQLRVAPLENVGLVEALKKQCEALGFRTGAQVELQLGTLPPSNTLAPGAQQAIFRVAQEALANIGRHARAKNVSVRLDAVRDQLVLRIRDDGSGFDTSSSARGMGIANMRERAAEFGGQIELESRPGEGATVTLTIPYVTESPDEYRRMANIWGVILIANAAAAIWTQAAPIAISVAVMAAVGFSRQIVALTRLKKRPQSWS